MLGVNQSDFMSYMSALKSNYRKGVHRMEAILSNPTHAKEFAANLGGVSVVLGVPVNLPDRNSDKLLELLLGSDVADDAVETWLHQFYEFTGWDDLLSDSARCKEMANNPLIWRAAGGSKLAVGKSIATLAGLSCADYADIDAVAASQVAMAAIIANATALNAVVTSSVAMAAVIGNATALNAVVTSSVAMTAVAASQVAMTAIQKSQTALNAIAASSMATAKYAAGAAGLNPADYADMTAIAASQVAMTAIVKSPVAMAAMWRSDTAIKALQANATAWKTFTGASSAVMGKTVAILANLDPSGYADMTAVAASQVAMTAVAASQVAMAAIIANATALNAVVTSSVAMTAVAASQVAMTAVAASNTATKAIAASQTALNAIAGSTTALDALYAKKSRLTGASASKSGKFIILQISNDSAFDTSRYGYATLSDGSQPNWQDYKSKYAYFKQFKKIATYIKNDTEGDDWIDYFPCG